MEVTGTIQRVLCPAGTSFDQMMEIRASKGLQHNANKLPIYAIYVSTCDAISICSPRGL